MLFPLLLLLVVPLPHVHAQLRFHLRHLHATISNSSNLIFSDVLQAEVYSVDSRHLTSYRPTSFSAFSSARFRSVQDAQCDALLWREANVVGPDIKRRETLLTLAKMTSNAYTTPDKDDWYSIDPFNNSFPFGWEPDADGFRGHVFASEDNSTVVISVKGTSVGWLAGGGGPTVKKDHLNDNLLFSCCCARVGPTWSTVCDCFSGGYKCDQTCVEQSLIDESLFYPIGINLYNNVTYMYPEANIWLIGHSLGGSLAALIGATFGAPTVAIEAPGDTMAARRLHLPSPPSTLHITHVYHTADPLAMGTCTGVTSVCSLAGYAMESKCHSGQVMRYDTVTHKGLSVSPRYHGIQYVIDNVLAEDWEHGEEGSSVPELITEDDCVDCYNWEYGDFKTEKTLTQ